MASRNARRRRWLSAPAGEENRSHSQDHRDNDDRTHHWMDGCACLRADPSAKENPLATLSAFLAIEIGLIVVTIVLWRFSGRDVGDVTLVRRNLARLVSVGPRELNAMCTEACVMDLLRCPDYVVHDDTGTPFQTFERATCLMWAPAVNVPFGYGECEGYGGSDAYGVRRFSVYTRRPVTSVAFDKWPIIRMTVEIYADQIRFVPDFSVSFNPWHGHGWAAKRKDPSLSFGAGMLAPKYDLDFGADRYGGNVYV
ncbi:hypothetical protein [Bifidobacterium tissieri]|nr:hypothetical protein [Bifidobacterium tissieri]